MVLYTAIIHVGDKPCLVVLRDISLQCSEKNFDSGFGGARELNQGWLRAEQLS